MWPTLAESLGLVCVEAADLTPPIGEREPRMPLFRLRTAVGRRQIVSGERGVYEQCPRVRGDGGRGEKREVTRGRKVGRRMLRIGRKTPNFFTVFPFEPLSSQEPNHYEL